jgi:hypothetical protein
MLTFTVGVGISGRPFRGDFMRLRDISEQIRELLEGGTEALFSDEVQHALVQEIQDVQIVYRPIAPGGRKDNLVAWTAFSFMPYRGLIEPFNIYPSRFWVLLRMHKQPSGLPELVCHVARELPSASTLLSPDLVVSFSNSPRVETAIEKAGREPAILRFFHAGTLMDSQGNALAAQYCLPGFLEALSNGDVDDGIPGLVGEGESQRLYLGDLVFYNGYKTIDRGRLRHFLMNCVAVSVVARYVRDILRKNLAGGN